MQGQISTSLPYWVDICGYVYQTREKDADGNATVKTVNMWVGTHPQFESGERVQGMLPDNVMNPNIAQILKTVYPTNETQESTSE
jgi:hypothetical protein